MTVLQRRILGVGGVLVVLIALVFALTSGDSGEERLAVRGRAEDAPSTTTSTTAPEGEGTGTTVPLVPVTTGVPVPEPSEAPPVTEAPSATPAAPRTSTSAAAPGSAVDGTVVTAEGATMTRSPSNAVRAVDKAKGCNSAGGDGWKIENCGALRTNGTVLLWIVESKGKATRALVLKEQTAGRWLVVLSAADVNGSMFDTIGVRGQDVTGDGQAELVFGFHRKDAARTLSVDVVDASPAVTLHRNLPGGAVRLAAAEITTWAASGSGDRTYDQVAIRFAGGAWRASAAQAVARSAVPASMV